MASKDTSAKWNAYNRQYKQTHANDVKPTKQLVKEALGGLLTLSVIAVLVFVVVSVASTPAPVMDSAVYCATLVNGKTECTQISLDGEMPQTIDQNGLVWNRQ